MVLFLKMISFPHLMYPLVLDNNYGLIMDIIPFKYNQYVSMSRGWRLMATACKWMDHPPPSLLLPEVCCCQIGSAPPLSLSLLWSNTAL